MITLFLTVAPCLTITLFLMIALVLINPDACLKRLFKLTKPLLLWLFSPFELIQGKDGVILTRLAFYL